MFCRLSKHFARTEKHQRDEARSHRRPSKSPSPRNRRRPSKSPEPKKRRKFRESSKSPENTSSSGKHKKYHVGIAHIFLIYDECQPQTAKVFGTVFSQVQQTNAIAETTIAETTTIEDKLSKKTREPNFYYVFFTIRKKGMTFH